MIILEHDRIGEIKTVIRSPARPDGVFLEPAPAGSCLPCIEQNHADSIEFLHPARRPAGDPAEPLEEIQKHPLGPENSRGGTGQFKQDIFLRHHRALGSENRNSDPFIDLRKQGLGDRGAAEDSPLASNTARDNPHPGKSTGSRNRLSCLGKEKVGGEITTGKILRKGALDKSVGLESFRALPGSVQVWFQI